MRRTPAIAFSLRLVLAAGVALPPRLAVATAPEADAHEDAGREFSDGRKREEVSDYQGAIEHYERALGLLLDLPGQEPQVARVRRRLATAHRKAYGIDGDVAHLLKARDQLTSYLEIADPAWEDRRAEAQAELAEVEGLIAAAQEQEGTDETSEPSEPDGSQEREKEPQGQTKTDEPHSAPAPEGPPAEPEPERRRTADAAPAKPRTRGLIISGGVLLGLGAGAAGVMVAGLVGANAAKDRFESELDDRPQARDDYDRNNGLAIGGGVAAGVLLVTGTTLLTLGIVRRNKRTATLTPTIGPDWVGASWRASF